MRSIIEPFKIKMVEPLSITTREHRQTTLKQAHYNLFLIGSKDVTFDFLTDSGTTAMSANQWAAMMVADESYAGSRSFEKFERTVRDLTGYSFVIPTHQGRAAERILFQTLIKPGSKIPSNTHFDTTRANIEQCGGEAVDLVCAEGKIPSLVAPFKGNADLIALEKFCSENKNNIPLGMLTVTNNSAGGQPVSLENIRAVSAIYQKYGIPFFLDACRFAENSYFIQQRENGMKHRSVKDIAQEIFSLAQGCTMSAKKDGLVNIGGFLALQDMAWAQSFKNLLILTEGFPTYGGLAARDLEALSVGLEEVLSEDYLSYRMATSSYLAKGLNDAGIPTVQPAGGHAVYIDAAQFLPHIPKSQFPGQSLVCEMYLREGLRTCEIGSAMFGDKAQMELVRIAIPRRVYTQSHFDYVIEGLGEMAKTKNELRGMKIVQEPPFLRHFTAQFDYV